MVYSFHVPCKIQKPIETLSNTLFLALFIGFNYILLTQCVNLCGKVFEPAIGCDDDDVLAFVFGACRNN